MAKRAMPVRKEVVPEKVAPVQAPAIDAHILEDHTSKPVRLMVDHCSSLNVRAAANKKASVLTTARQGTIVVVKDLVEDWLEVSIPSLKINGYILAQYTSEVD